MLYSTYENWPLSMQTDAQRGTDIVLAKSLRKVGEVESSSIVLDENLKPLYIKVKIQWRGIDHHRNHKLMTMRKIPKVTERQISDLFIDAGWKECLFMA